MSRRSELDDDIETVSEWLTSRGWKVEMHQDGGSYIRPHEGRVVIDTSESRSEMLNSILHEAGHVSIIEEPLPSQYPAGYSANGGTPDKRSRSYRIDVLLEEVEAWRRGRILAQTLGISLKGRSFIMGRNAAIKSYAEWASKSR